MKIFLFAQGTNFGRTDLLTLLNYLVVKSHFRLVHCLVLQEETVIL